MTSNMFETHPPSEQTNQPPTLVALTMISTSVTIPMEVDLVCPHSSLEIPLFIPGQEPGRNARDRRNRGGLSEKPGQPCEAEGKHGGHGKQKWLDASGPVDHGNAQQSQQ